MDESGEKHGIAEKILDKFPEISVNDNVKYCLSGTSESTEFRRSLLFLESLLSRIS